MGVCKGERFIHEDIYVDYPFENVMFRWSCSEKNIYRKFYGENEFIDPVPHDNKLFNNALCFGDEITKEVYLIGKTP